MQGFVNQRTFYATVSPTSQKTSSTDGGDSDATATRADPSTTAKSPFIFTIISRRSIKRAGLRYLRRGVDTQGNVANNVETEQLLTVPSPATPDNPEWIRTYSFLQIRGSIPIFFQQSPYALRPRPTLLHGEEQNRLAFKKHFDHVKERYGDVFCVSLVERGSAERIVGEKYEKYAEEFNAEGKHDYRIGFEWFDFHKVCKGMRFEKVSELLEGLEDMLNKFGWTEVLDSGHEKVGAQENQHGTVKSSQKGLMRTNCMDCLDRTNVVQSAFARRGNIIIRLALL